MRGCSEGPSAAAAQPSTAAAGPQCRPLVSTNLWLPSGGPSAAAAQPSAAAAGPQGHPLVSTNLWLPYVACRTVNLTGGPRSASGGLRRRARWQLMQMPICRHACPTIPPRLRCRHCCYVHHARRNIASAVTLEHIGKDACANTTQPQQRLRASPAATMASRRAAIRATSAAA